LRYSLLHPSRSRPNKSFQTTQDWLNSASGKDFELIVSIDESDPHKDQYLNIYSNYNQFKTRVIVNPNQNAVQAINNAAKVADGEILIVVSDDTGVLRGWDNILTQTIGTHVDFVLKVYDGIQDWIVTMPIMDKVYYNRFGYIYHPEYQHMFCDTHLTHVADALGKLIIRNDILIKHEHYSITKGQKDQVTIAADSTHKSGMKTYLRLIRENLQLDPTIDIWNLSRQARGHLEWLKNVRQAT
jgi:glycosyltransferase involved in cell wall biosynthesis